MRTLIYCYLIIFGLLLHGCSLLPEPTDETKDWSASRIYSEAKDAMNASDYEDAIKYYEMLESRYPFGRYAEQGQIEIAYVYYKYDEPESAIGAADRFIKLHPNHPHVDYAYYLKGLINFNRDAGFLSRLLRQDLTTRDPSAAKTAFQDFSTLVQKFPNSRYSADARQRMLYLRNSLSEYEIRVARYYMTRGAYVAAANRCKYLIENYERTRSVPEALEVLAEAYDKLKLPILAADARRVLTASYPDYLNRPKQEKAWWDIIRD